MIRRQARQAVLGKSYALHELDYKLGGYVRRRSGFFIEAGAYDGLRQSNTAWFEKRRGWRGLLVEPDPDLAAKCKVNRPASMVENVALVADSKTTPEVELVAAGLVGMVADTRNLLDPQSYYQNRTPPSQRRIKVGTATLSDLIDRHHIERVDLLSLDVEGYELQALAGLDLDRHRPGAIVVECRRLEDTIEMLQPHYQQPIQLSYHDYLFLADDDSRLQR